MNKRELCKVTVAHQGLWSLFKASRFTIPISDELTIRKLKEGLAGLY